jgi:DNA polymerase III subunit delta
MAELKPAYLIHGEDEVKLDAWRARIRDRAAREEALLELMDAARDSGEEVAMALSSMTLSMGTRYVVVDGIERWKDKDVTPVVQALASSPPDTVVVLLGTTHREPGRKPWAPPAKLVKAVEKAGGEVSEHPLPKASQVPGWIAERGKQVGLAVDRDAAQALLERIGNDQRRLMRELEKIACYAPEGGRVTADVVDELTASDIEAKAYELADAVIEGDRARALRLAEDLQDRGTDIMHILYAMLRRTHEMRRAWAVIETGGSTADVAAALGLRQSWMAKRIVPQAKAVDGERLERILAALADLDYAIRGGGKVDTQTALTLTLAA